MNVVLDFICAAFPWIAMGLLLASFAAGSDTKDKKGRKPDREEKERGAQI